MSQTVTITNLSDERERVHLPEPFFTAEARGQEDFTGVWITGLFYGPRTHRMVAKTYSIWDDGHGRNVGERYRELDTSLFLHYCQKVRIDPPDGLSAEDL